MHTVAPFVVSLLLLVAVAARAPLAQQPPPAAPVCEDTDPGGPLAWDLTFTPDPGVRVVGAALPKPYVDEAGRVHLFYEQAFPGGRQMYAVSDDGLTFANGRVQQPADLRFHPYRVRMPNGVWRMYTMNPQAAVELRSNSSGDGVVFTGDAGVRYTIQPDDKGWMGVYDVYVDPQDRVVLLYLGDKEGLNNVRRAVSTDQGWTFAFQRGDVLGDSAEARARGASAAFVDQKSTPLHDGRRRLFAMRRGCAIYSFVSTDGDTYTRDAGARVTTTAFSDVQVRSLHDPVVVRLADGRYRMYVAATLQNATGADGAVIVTATTASPPVDPPNTPGPPLPPPNPPAPPPGTPPPTRPPAATGSELLERARQANPARYQFAIDRGAEIKPTADGRSFFLAWYPDGSTEENRPPTIVTLHGSESWALDEFVLWYPHLLERGYGIIALQWWFGGGSGPADYYQPQDLYRALDVALDREEITTGTAMLHGFSRGSASSYGIVALDGESGRRYFALTVANAGGAAADFPINQDIAGGRFGAQPFAGTHWVMYCGGQDPNPARDGCDGMRAARGWVSQFGGIVDALIEDPDGGHGGFHQRPGNTRHALDLFAARLRR